MWKTVAEGPSLGELSTAIKDMELPKGSRMRVVFDAPGFDWLFDMAGAEWVFKGIMPDGMDTVDVWGENGQGIVEMEADPAWLLATLLFIKAHWLAIIIAGIVLTAVVAYVRVMVWTVAAKTPFPAFLICAIAFGIILLMPKYQVAKERWLKGGS